MPKYFIILYTGTELWWKYINWLNATYNVYYSGDAKSTYYGYDGGRVEKGTNYGQPAEFIGSPEIITLEQWDQWNNKETNYSIY